MKFIRALPLIGLLLSASIFAQTAVIGTSSNSNRAYDIFTWGALAKNTAGNAAPAGTWRGVKTVQIIVTAAGEQNLTMQGSMDGTNWVTLHGIELDSGEYFSLTSITSSMLVTIIENPLYIRPLISNEAGATAVDIDVILGAYTRN